MNYVRIYPELDSVLAESDYSTYEAIDDVLRNWLAITAGLYRQAPDRQEDIATCVNKLLTSYLFAHCHGNDDNNNGDAPRRTYVRTQMIHSLLQEDDPARLYVIACFLLIDGRGAEEATFPRMVGASCFPRLIQLIGGSCRERDPSLYRLLLQLIYEMAGMERLTVEDLLHVEDSFVQGLFNIIEGVSDDPLDPYHYSTIRVLVRAAVAIVFCGV